jgi:hypothetical protein
MLREGEVEVLVGLAGANVRTAAVELQYSSAKTRLFPSQISAPEASSESADLVTLSPRSSSVLRTSVDHIAATARLRMSAMET